jgi:hypothetical protein
MTERFEDFLRCREHASSDYIGGDAAALAAMLTAHDPASFMPPTGAEFQHADQVANTQIEGAQAFGPDDRRHFEILNSGSSDTLRIRGVRVVEHHAADDDVRPGRPG